MNDIQGVLFDADGTLIDTYDIILASMRYAVNDVLGLEAQVKVNEQDASLTLKLPRNLEGEADQVCQTLLAALMVYFVQLQEEYPQHINVMEV